MKEAVTSIKKDQKTYIQKFWNNIARLQAGNQNSENKYKKKTKSFENEA